MYSPKQSQTPGVCYCIEKEEKLVALYIDINLSFSFDYAYFIRSPQGMVTELALQVNSLEITQVVRVQNKCVSKLL